MEIWKINFPHYHSTAATVKSLDITLILLLALTWQARQMWTQTCKMPLSSCSDFQPFTNLASRASVNTLCKFCLQNRSGFHPFTNFASRASGYPNLKKLNFCTITLPLVGDNPKPHKLKYFLQNYFKHRFSEAYVFIKIKNLCFVKRTIVRCFYNISFQKTCQYIFIDKILFFIK